MLETISPRDMRSLENQIMRDSGLPSLLLMEHAAQAVADTAVRMTGGNTGTVLVLCGPGNNGGDGFAAARLLIQRNVHCRIWQLSEELSPDSEKNRRILLSLYPLTECVTLLDDLPPIPADTVLVLDALFGTGLSRPMEDMAALLCEAVNQSGIPVLSVDIPSGLDGETGKTPGCCFIATETVTFHRPKTGLYLGAGPDVCGKITVADIGLPREADHIPGMKILEDSELALPPRRRRSSKGDYGRLVIIAGAMGMCGAAAVCARAALNAGAGLVTLLAPAESVPVLQTLCPCAMAKPLTLENTATLLASADAAVVGPGLGRMEEWLVETVLDSGVPTLWDADGLNALSRLPELPLLKERDVITPHPGEAARLLQTEIVNVCDDPVNACRRLNELLGCVAVLKDAVSLVTDGMHWGLNNRGTPAMAKGGSGDALAGIIGALMAQKNLPMTSFDKALLGMGLHARAGERLAAHMGEASPTAWDLACEPFES